jgi:hypothetical protein
MADAATILTILAIVWPITIALFLIFRRVVCWYWKINRGIALLEEGVALLRQIKDSANRAEIDGLDRHAAELKRGTAAPGPYPPR